MQYVGQPSAFKRTFNKTQGESYGQFLPAGGWTGYLAGTEFLAISTQVVDNPINMPQVLGVGKAMDASGMLTTRTHIGKDGYDVPDINNPLVQTIFDSSPMMSMPQ